MTEKEFHKISPRGDYLVGKKFNKVTVIDFDKKEGYDLWWNCICDCGKKFKTTSRKLRTNPNISCGCSKKTVGIDLTGQTFGRLTVISKAENLNGKWAWNTKENFELLKKHDNIKNQWCKENNIPLIRIPYTHLDNLKIEDLKLETSSFII